MDLRRLLTVEENGSRRRGVNERSCEEEGMKGGALVGLSQPYLGCGWFSAKIKKKKKDKRKRVSDMWSDLICSHNVCNQKGQPVSGENEKKKLYYKDELIA